MKLLLDQGLPRSTVQQLAAIGIVAEHVGNLGLAAASDHVILDEARNRGEVVVTLDADFHALLAHAGASGPSVIRLRIEGLDAARRAQILSQVLAVAATDLAAGAAVSVTPPDLVRIRRLPIAT
jgi:predicted nuclease of predicted toxin-antitoxin system